jgi:hypothetical protein
MDALRQRKGNRNCVFQVVLIYRVAACAATTQFNTRLNAIGNGSLIGRPMNLESFISLIIQNDRVESAGPSCIPGSPCRP